MMDSNANARKMNLYLSFVILGFVFLLLTISLELSKAAISNAQLPGSQLENAKDIDKISQVDKTSYITLYNLVEDTEDNLKNASTILEFASM